MSVRRTFFPLAAVALTVCAHGAAFSQTAKDFVEQFLEPMAKGDKPIFVAECSYRRGGWDGKELLILPIDNSNGLIVDLGWGSGVNRGNPQVVNQGSVTFAPKIAVQELEWGGPGAYQLQTQVVEYLVSTAFILVYPDAFHSLVGSEPKTACQPSQ